MIWAWATAKGALGLAKGLWGVIAIVGLALIAWAIVGTVRGTLDDATETGRQSGRSEVIIEGQGQTLEQLGDANDAEQNLRVGGERSAERFAECLRNSRRKEACERYRPLPRPE